VRWVVGTFFGVALGLASVAPAAALAATPAPAPATVYATVALSQATWARSYFYVNPPASLTTVGGVPFTLGNAYWLRYGDAPASLSVNVNKPKTVYLLLNTSWTDAAFAGQTVGTVHLTFSDGTSRDTALVVGANMREWEFGAPGVVSTLTSTATVSVWQGMGQAAVGGATATMDMLTIPAAPAASTALLTGVTVSITNSSHMGIVFQGLTVLDDPIVPVVSDKSGDHNSQVGHQDKDKEPKHTILAHKPAKPSATDGKHDDKSHRAGHDNGHDSGHDSGHGQGERD
jgi:hypothetical protein